MTTTGLHSIVFPVDDLEAAKRIYTTLLGEPHTDQPYYVGYRVGDVEIGLDPNGAKRGQTVPVGNWSSSDLDATIAELTAAGATVTEQPRDVGGPRVATLTDADGNPFGLIG
ncbi:putative enzyme related to lactoylglutathione lyase [Friedmanniella endophytica]|uniref:Putative enzyme related to lactoylglutathione lyase n=1 Tax=Microlunatus kandeliicorticis TaxID=1759536 RepID=A0A7W3IQY6_9ACTN|nr:VOC family protein [Microlunatus kandeliicorticis]MBA8793585.1 putative enzyme related to lactoylglutathione lyase [Microlunatus kandeliicorticis]